MIELAFVACLAWAPLQCEERNLTFADVPLMTCMTGAQAFLAQWRNGNPGWRVARWSCGAVGRRGLRA